MNNVTRSVTLGTVVIAMSVFVFHFAMTVLYVFPLNPIKAGLLSTISDYAGNLFAQNWSLFAPMPVHQNVHVLVQCRAGNKESGWFDLTSAFEGGLHSFPAGPYVRLVRMPMKALRDAIGSDTDPEMAALLNSTCKPGRTHDVCMKSNPVVRKTVAQGRSELQGLASAVCEDVYPGTLTAMRATGTVMNLRPWSQRDSTHWHSTVTTVAATAWMAPRAVAPMPFNFGRQQ